MKLAIIGGSGALDLFGSKKKLAMTTPFGAPSDRPCEVEFGPHRGWFLARHGNPHRVAPHRVNYRANIHALKALGADSILAINAVGAINADIDTGELVIPDQIIDYTSGRAHTFSDGGSAPLRHIDFTWPYAGPLRQLLVQSAADAGVAARDGACHGVVQGPRLETAAEIRRLKADGCDLVGMTAMPEAALAREAGLDYASLCIVANPAAGVGEGAISEEDIRSVLARSMARVRKLVVKLVESLDPTDPRIT
ncbi:MAG: S-methyl-5'-thioinosine phosphorylase [Xanthomonadaceae bacterium]|nr:S-methyl-5'-thioinosine phosphorylase [Xanthomonadaceae bacterium]